jgi:hypothetical protein
MKISFLGQFFIFWGRFFTFLGRFFTFLGKLNIFGQISYFWAFFPFWPFFTFFGGSFGIISSNIPSLDGRIGDFGKTILTVGGSLVDATERRSTDFVGIESCEASGALFVCKN